MSQPFIHFIPAQLSVGKKDTYVFYYALNPLSEKLERKRVRINHIQGRADRVKYGKLLCLELNEKLYQGWNPFLSDMKASGNLTVRQAVSAFLKQKQNLRPDSVRAYNSNSKKFMEWAEAVGWADKFVCLFSPDMARRYMRHIESTGVGGKTFNNYLLFQNTLFLWFVKRDYLKENPFTKIDHKRVEEKMRTTIPAADRKKILEYFNSTGLDGFVCVMKLCYRLFIRPKEIMMLKIGDIDFKNGMLTISSKVAKNHHERVLGVPEEIMAYFNTISGCDPSMYIFSEKYKPGKVAKNARDIGRTWSIMRKELKLPASYQFYSLKDTGITEMLEAGVPPKYVKELADHHSLEMTERYTHRSEAKKILEWNKLEF